MGALPKEKGGILREEEKRWEWERWKAIVWDKCIVWFEKPTVFQMEILSR